MGRLRLSAALATVIVVMVTIPLLLLQFSSTSFQPTSQYFAFADVQLVERELGDKIESLSSRVEKAEALSRISRDEVERLKQQLDQASSSHKSRGALWRGEETEVSPLILHLPHLKNLSPHDLQPITRISRGRSGVSIVIGVPTVKRQVQSYLMSTLQNLIECMNPEERSSALILVFVAETDEAYVAQISAEIEEMFPEHIQSGLLEVISPPSVYYPNMNYMKPTLGDGFDRFQWRSKQNLDYAYMMMYGQSRGSTYLQLEDDVLAKTGFLTVMKDFSANQTKINPDWLILDFCQLGFIGKMFKSVDLTKILTFFALFYNDKPVDWLLDNFVQTKVCRFDKDSHDCKKRKDAVWIKYRPSLFQHVGTHSSLKGKVQKLKDRNFGRIPLFISHRDNPKAELSTTLKHYKAYTLTRAYRGDGFFWAISPQSGDNITIHFVEPVEVESILFRSGNPEHPSDKMNNVTAWACPVSAAPCTSVGRSRAGLIEAVLPTSLGPLQEVRLHFPESQDHWLLMSEIHIRTPKAKEGTSESR